MKKYNWGIIGTGYAANLFAYGLRFSPNANLLAVASRTIDKAKEFCKTYKINNAYGSYEELVNDKAIDIVYIATPHVMHKENSILSLKAGKSILCEKPFTVNTKEAKEVISLARQKNLFCMEAMWTRFLPITQKVNNIIREGQLGDVKLIIANFGNKVKNDPNNRFFSLKLGGGALLDLGVYLISLASMIFGKPTDVQSSATIGTTGIDEQSSYILKYSKGQQAILTSSLLVNGTNDALIIGTRRILHIHAPIYSPIELNIIKNESNQFSDFTHKQNKLKDSLQNMPVIRYILKKGMNLITNNSKKIILQFRGNGYNYEADEVMRSLALEERESRFLPLDETIAIIETMDTIRSQWNLKYPIEGG